MREDAVSYLGNERTLGHHHHISQNISQSFILMSSLLTFSNPMFINKQDS